jgi:hypothetical protein
LLQAAGLSLPEKVILLPVDFLIEGMMTHILLQESMEVHPVKAV